MLVRLLGFWVVDAGYLKGENIMDRQKIDLRNIIIGGRVLDIGGGGEGVVARHVGDDVVVIDNRKDELEESPDMGIKIVMDARELLFLENTFDSVVCFFSLMYMSDETIAKCLSQAHRVLKTGGVLWLWDAVIPPSDGEDIFVIQLAIQLNTEEITTGYGVGFGGGYKGQSMADVVNLCDISGFDVVETSESEQWFFIKAVK